MAIGPWLRANLAMSIKTKDQKRPERKVGFEPGRSKAGGWREEESLCDDGDLHEVAEVEHEEVVVDRSVGRVSQKHQKYQGHLRLKSLDKDHLFYKKKLLFKSIIRMIKNLDEPGRTMERQMVMPR